MDIQSFDNIIISGASSAIASQIAMQLKELNANATVVGLSSDLNKIKPIQNWDHLIEVNYQSAESLSQAKDSLPFKRLDLMIFCNGFLHDEVHSPEKRLEDCDPTRLLKSFEVNTVALLMVAKTFKSMFKHDRRSGFFALSAMVGSITDNRIGGWYGYRSSKAAMNMSIKNISIEFERSNYKTSVHAIHPGTTHSPLSKPFTGSRKPDTVYSPEVTARRIMQVIEQLDKNATGGFYHWDGSTLPW